MKYWMLLLVFPCTIAYGQINVMEMGAKGNGRDDDYAVIQKALDSAVKRSENVYLPRGRYRISKPLMIARFADNQYQAVTTRFYGDDNMWSSGAGISVLICEGEFGLGIQRGKGVRVEGIFFLGAFDPPKLPFDSIYRTTLKQYTTQFVKTRSSRYSPHAAIVIDPFSGNLPQDGGYPQMKNWYRGPQTRSGSTGCRVDDCTFYGWYIGAITSPNGYTQNAELITFENMRITNCVIGFAGCQAQEKMNRVVNLGAWGVTHTLFVFNSFGFGQPGHWVADGINVAGQVVNLIHRSSGSFFPFHFTNVFAESLGSIGWWGSGCGDAMTNSSINFVYPDQVKSYTIHQLTGITFTNCNLRYYGQFGTPLTFGMQSFDLRFQSTQTYCPPVWGRLPGLKDSVPMGDYALLLAGYSHAGSFRRNGNNISCTPVRSGKYLPREGDQVIIVNMSDYTIWGQAKVVSSSGKTWTMDYISPFLDEKSFSYYIYKPRKKKPRVNALEAEPAD